MRWIFLVLAACGGNGDSRHIADGPSGSGSATGPAGYVEFALDTEDAIYSVAAFYPSQSSTTPTDSCTRMAQGLCSTVICPAAPTGGSTATNDDAGTITITGGSPSQTVTLKNGADHAYNYSGGDNAHAQYPAGTLLTMTGTGATVPAFSGTVVMPNAPTVTAPVIGSTLSRSSDLALTWTGGDAGGEIIFELFQPPYSFVECAFPSGGSATVPSALIQLMAAGSATAIVNEFSAKTQTVGDYSISFETSVPGLAPGEAGYFAAPVNLQ